MSVPKVCVERTFLVLILFGVLNPLQFSNKANTNSKDMASNSTDQRLHLVQTHVQKDGEKIPHAAVGVRNENLSQLTFPIDPGETNMTLINILADVNDEKFMPHLTNKGENKTNLKPTNKNDIKTPTAAGMPNDGQDGEPPKVTPIVDNMNKDPRMTESRGTTESEEEVPTGLDKEFDTKQHRLEDDTGGTKFSNTEQHRHKEQLGSARVPLRTDNHMDTAFKRKGDDINVNFSSGKVLGTREDYTINANGTNTLLRKEDESVKESVEDINTSEVDRDPTIRIDANNNDRLGENTGRESGKENSPAIVATGVDKNLGLKDGQISDSFVSSNGKAHRERSGTEVSAALDEMLEKKYGLTNYTFGLLMKFAKKNRLTESLHAADTLLDQGNDRAEYKRGPNETCGSTDGFGLGRTENTRQKRDGYYTDACTCAKCEKPPVRSDGKVNVAWNKPTMSSSDYTGSDSSTLAGSCGAVNGLTANPTTTQPNCFRTGTVDKRPFWLLDLQEVRTIKTINIYRRNQKDNTYYEKYTSIYINGLICYTFPLVPSHNASGSTEVKCVKPLRGRWVQFQQMIPADERHLVNILMFCEIQIFVCTGFTYPNPFTRRCIQCPNPCLHGCDNYYGCSTLVMYNIAMRKPTTSSPLVFGSNGNAVNGFANTLSRPEDCLMTQVGISADKHPYWQVDLEKDYHVYYVSARGRMDLVKEMADFHVLVLRTDTPANAEIDFAGRREHCYHWSHFLYNGTDTNQLCHDAPILGRYVMAVAKLGTKLHLCEVLVKAHDIEVLKPGQSGCASPTKMKVCEPDRVCENDVCKITVGDLCRAASSRFHCEANATCDFDICKYDVDSKCQDKPDMCKTDTECDQQSGYRCKFLPGKKCRSSSQCSRGSLCDYISECRMGTGQTCSRDTQCAAGADCTKYSKCECKDHFIYSDTEAICEPPCHPNETQPCQDAKASCIKGDTLCKCPADYDTTPRDFQCVPSKAGVEASCSKTGDCKSGMTCDKLKCRLPVRSPCSADQNCLSGALCDVFTCRYDAGSGCTLSPDCKINTTCEGGHCKVSVGKDCTGKEAFCVLTTKCAKKNNHNICLKDVGTSCYGDNRTLCIGGTVCDHNFCRIKTGGPCNSAFCQYSSTCEDGQCKLILGANCKNHEKFCVKGSTCDSLHRCRIPKGQSCEHQPEGCLSGGVCNKEYVCECDPVNTKTTNMCAPVPGAVGGACVGGVSCIANLTRCNNTDHSCNCIAGFGVQRNNYTCKLAAGSSCNFTYDCASDLVCSASHICELLPGTFCEGKAKFYCGRRGFCDEDEICRLLPGSNCTLYPDSCKLGLVCDMTSVCKIAVGTTCFVNDDCAAGSKCIDFRCACEKDLTKQTKTRKGIRCDPEAGMVGGPCGTSGVQCSDVHAKCNDGNICECEAGFWITRELGCKKGIDMGCREDDECAEQLYCDNVGICKMSIGGQCDAKYDMCGDGAVCDIDETCKLGLSGDCRGVNVGQCMTGTICDWLHKCRKGVGFNCNASKDCSTGAFCSKTLCVCDLKISKQHSFICEPLIGRVGADCNAVSKKCSVTGSVCREGKCRCDSGYLPTQEFSCEQPAANLAANLLAAEVESIALTVGLCLLAVLVIVAFVILANRRSQHKKKELEKIRSERRLSMAQLSTVPTDTKPETLAEAKSETSGKDEESTTVADQSEISSAASSALTSSASSAAPD